MSSPRDVPTRTAQPEPSAAPGVVWRAAYRTVATSGSGFTGEIRLTNIGTASASGWTITITLPDGATLSKVRGVEGGQSGSTVTFVPKNARKPVRPGATEVFEFTVSGPGSGPTSCRVDGGTCTGIPE